MFETPRISLRAWTLPLFVFPWIARAVPGGFSERANAFEERIAEALTAEPLVADAWTRDECTAIDASRAMLSAGEDPASHATARRDAATKPTPTTGAFTWTKLATEPYPGKQDDIYFVSPLLGWYVNGAGKIFKTTDGGATWTEKLHKPGTYFRCIAFVDEKVGFAGNIGPDYFPKVTDKCPLYRTDDGGDTWTPVTDLGGAPIIGLCAIEIAKKPFINAGNLDQRVTIFAAGRVGGPAVFVSSEDLGRTWKQVDLSTQCGMVLDVHFRDRDHGFLAAASSADVEKSHALILATKDGGATWTPVYRSERSYELTWKMSFPSDEIGYVTIQSYDPSPKESARFVAKTTDGGATWKELPFVDDAKVREFGVAFLNEKVGWIGAMPGGFQTEDGGSSWKRIEMGNAVNKIRIVKSESETVGYAIGVDVHKLVVAREK